MAYIVAWRSGEVEVNARVPQGALNLMKGPKRRLEELLSGKARLAYDGKTLLVPGVPEATDGDDAAAAVLAFQMRLNQAVTGKVI